MYSDENSFLIKMKGNFVFDRASTKVFENESYLTVDFIVQLLWKTKKNKTRTVHVYFLTK